MASFILSGTWIKPEKIIFSGPSDEQYEQLLEILKNRLEDGLGECVYEVDEITYLAQFNDSLYCTC